MTQLRKFWLALLLLINVAPALASSLKKQEAWTAFRAAFLKKDFAKLAELADFPVELHGILDDDPQYEVGKKRFAGCFALIYKEDAGDGRDHLQLVKDSRDLSKVMDNGKPVTQSPDNQDFRIGSMEFVPPAFKLKRFYLDTATSAGRGVCH